MSNPDWRTRILKTVLWIGGSGYIFCIVMILYIAVSDLIRRMH